MRSRRTATLAQSADVIDNAEPGLSMHVGILRLRNCFAARSSCSAQDDTVWIVQMDWPISTAFAFTDTAQALKFGVLRQGSRQEAGALPAFQQQARHVVVLRSVSHEYV